MPRSSARGTAAICATDRASRTCAEAGDAATAATHITAVRNDTVKRLVMAAAPPIGSRLDGEVDVLRESLTRDLVRHLDLEPIVAHRKTRQRHDQAARQLVAGGDIELRRQSRRIQQLRRRLVEVFLTFSR